MTEPKNKLSAGGKSPGKGDPGRETEGAKSCEAAMSWRREEQKGALAAGAQHR